MQRTDRSRGLLARLTQPRADTGCCSVELVEDTPDQHSNEPTSNERLDEPNVVDTTHADR